MNLKFWSSILLGVLCLGLIVYVQLRIDKLSQRIDQLDEAKQQLFSNDKFLLGAISNVNVNTLVFKNWLDKAQGASRHVEAQGETNGHTQGK